MNLFQDILIYELEDGGEIEFFYWMYSLYLQNFPNKRKRVFSSKLLNNDNKIYFLKVVFLIEILDFSTFILYNDISVMKEAYLCV